VITAGDEAPEFNFFIKPITLEADLVTNRVRMMGCRTEILVVDFSKSTLFTKVLGFGSGQGGADGTFTSLETPLINYGQRFNPRNINISLERYGFWGAFPAKARADVSSRGQAELPWTRQMARRRTSAA
jgi:hypothetical protein